MSMPRRTEFIPFFVGRPIIAGIVLCSLVVACPIRAELVSTVAAIGHEEPASLAGEWRMFLPAGFEQRVELVAVGPNAFRLEPGNLTLGGRYEFREGRLLSADAHDAPHGFFSWKFRSAHLLTLVEQRAAVGSDYTGAILFRAAHD